MNSENITPEKVWERYRKDVDYKIRLDLFNKVKKQENFFIGRQWEGVNAPDLPKPVLNFTKRVTNYLISVLVVDDVGIAFRGYDAQPEVVAYDAVGNPVELSPVIEDILPKEVERVNENVKFHTLLRHSLRDGAVTGDAALYVRFNPGSGRGGGEQVAGEIEVEQIANTNIHFGDVMTSEKEKQPYIIISKLVLTNELKKQFPQFENLIRSDGDENGLLEAHTEDEVTTVLICLWKENGTVHFCQCTSTVMLKGPEDTGLKLYPVSYFNWEAVKNSYHGVGCVEEVIPNQIEVNKLWAMALLFQKNNSFPKVFIDKTKISSWDNRVGSVIGVAGNPNDVYASSFKAHDMSSQIIDLVERTISHTKEFMGANDVVLGNVNPQNTSALIQVQKASAAPLELQRLSFYQFIEDYVRVLIDTMRTKYGIRIVETENGQQFVDFSALDFDKDILVEIGQAAYWSETAQVQTMDNLFRAGIISDAVLYVENMPDHIVPNKNRILQHLKEMQQQQQITGGLPNEQMQM